MYAIAIEYNIRLFSVGSLKEKRAIRQSVLRRLEHDFRVSVAETGTQDDRHMLTIAVACVASHRGLLERRAQEIRAFLDRMTEGECVGEEAIFL